MAYVVTHDCNRCGASQDRRDPENVVGRRGQADLDCVLDVNRVDGHNFQPVGSEDKMSKREMQLQFEAERAQNFGIIGFLFGFGATSASLISSVIRVYDTDKGKLIVNGSFDGWSIVTVAVIFISIVLWIWIKIGCYLHKKFPNDGCFESWYDSVNAVASSICKCFFIQQLRIAMLGLLRRPFFMVIMTLFAYCGNDVTDIIIFTNSCLELVMLTMEFAILNDINLPCCTADKLEKLNTYMQIATQIND